MVLILTLVDKLNLVKNDVILRGFGEKCLGISWEASGAQLQRL